MFHVQMDMKPTATIKFLFYSGCAKYFYTNYLVCKADEKGFCEL